MKFSFKILLSVCAAILLELAVFNSDVWKMRLDKQTQKDVTFSLADVTPVNWHMEGDTYVSEIDPQLFIPTEAIRLYSVSVRYETQPQVTNCTLYYSNPDKTVSAMTNADIAEGQTMFRLNRMIGPVLRIDLGEEAEIRISTLQVVVNPTPRLHISVSRIAAVVLIYIVGSLLFRIQKMPDYTHYIQKKKEENA